MKKQSVNLKRLLKNLNHSSKIITALFLVVVLFALVGCNQIDGTDNTTRYDYGVYVQSVIVEDGVCTVRLSRIETDLMVGVSVITVSTAENGFFDRYDYTVTFDGNAIFSAVGDLLQQDVTLLNGQEYSTLKIIYDYDTIYKSMKSEGNQQKSDGEYHHSFEVEKAPFKVDLTRAVANQSVWYGVAISGALVLLALGLTLTYIRGKYGRKEQEN